MSAALEMFGVVFHLEDQRCCLLEEGDKEADLDLTSTEFHLFLMLVKSEGQTISRKALGMVAWENRDGAIESQGLDTLIAHLRKKIGNLRGSIISVYGQGYSFHLNKVKRIG